MKSFKEYNITPIPSLQENDEYISAEDNELFIAKIFEELENDNQLEIWKVLDKYSTLYTIHSGWGEMGFDVRDDYADIFDHNRTVFLRSSGIGWMEGQGVKELVEEMEKRVTKVVHPTFP